ncbi:cytochrome C5 [Pseudohongiella nitratireducens]|uniref:Cytochrome C5 n=1 Tax=Pseudohongiella nitratireducens TaxID=1768907 RepID=A0A917LUZ1_9GAMM|nr:c-type cytochrome [Pseudohongiella nitratireducens]GGG59677.1 cytochrome C5 [Pseudohongiella nitratireducens]|tara:strand:- start:770 stop:1219 length:450 start_codon:yes stop_codon:yes gene_type:complete
MLKLGLKSRAVKLVLIALGFSIAGAVVAQTRDEVIAERIAPVGQVCLLGEECAQGQAAASSGGAAAGGEFDVTATFDQNCAMCHNTGMAGAPRRDDTAHWEARLADAGFDTMVTNAINGVNAMPPRGMCTTCSDENIAELVRYLSGTEE